MNDVRTVFLRAAGALALGLLALGLAGVGGCARSAGQNAVTLQQAATDAEGDRRRIEIRAELATPTDGLTYKWFADYGECNPQESPSPITQFTFAEGTHADQVTVEVWRGGKRITQQRTEVREDAPLATVARPKVQIEITTLPYAEPGGPSTRATIAGRVIGDVPQDYRVIVYARDVGVWYIQPLSRSVHDIQPDKTWATWTHTGSAYAALVVRLGYAPGRTLDTLPVVGGDVIAKVAKDGRTKE